MKLLILVLLTALRAHAASVPYKQVDVLTCLPKTPVENDYGFTLGQGTGCYITPGGEFCDPRIAVKLKQFSGGVWQDDGMTSFPATLVYDKAAFTLDLDATGLFGGSRYVVHVKGPVSSVDAYQYSLIDTHGPSIAFECTFL